jgi:hypothetical protein
MNKIAIDMTRAITPPSLFGTDHRIANANRKYHSGWICTGVTRGFAGEKLSESLKTYGFNSVYYNTGTYDSVQNLLIT